jgi:hypothetical protein
MTAYEIHFRKDPTLPKWMTSSGCGIGFISFEGGFIVITDRGNGNKTKVAASRVYLIRPAL